MTAQASENTERYGIGAVARLTGLTDHTIRVWERRYGAVVAERAPNGRRIYKLRDVEKLGLLKQLTDSGLSIGMIANNDIDDLRERAERISTLASVELPDTIRVAVLGEMLPTQLGKAEAQLSPMSVALASNSLRELSADLEREAVDVVIVEAPILDDRVVEELRGLMKLGNAPRGVVAYGFGRSGDIERLRSKDIVLTRSPLSTDDIHAAVVRVFSHVPSSPARPVEAGTAEDWSLDGPIPARRFTQQQLAYLGMITTAIDCECPQHLAQLVSALSAFEVYSANCANRNDEDAVLHRYLHRTTAGARSMMERALERVAEADNLEY
jgi:DNA-binding transcriptional MerR regulator